MAFFSACSAFSAPNCFSELTYCCFLNTVMIWILEYLVFKWLKAVWLANACCMVLCLAQLNSTHEDPGSDTHPDLDVHLPVFLVLPICWTSQIAWSRRLHSSILETTYCSCPALKKLVTNPIAGHKITKKMVWASGIQKVTVCRGVLN